MSAPPHPPRQAVLVLPRFADPGRKPPWEAKVGGRTVLERLTGALREAGVERIGAAGHEGQPVAALPALTGPQEISNAEAALVVRPDRLLDRPAVDAFLDRATRQPDRPHIGYYPGEEGGGAIAYVPPALGAEERRELLREIAAPPAGPADEKTERAPSSHSSAIEVVLPGAARPKLAADTGHVENRLIDLAHPSSVLSRLLVRPVGRLLAAPMARAGAPARGLAAFAGALAAVAAILVAQAKPQLLLGGALFLGFALTARLAEVIALLRGDGRGSKLAPLTGVLGRWTFFAALGVAAFRAGDGTTYLWGLGLLALVGAYHLATLTRFLTEHPGPAASAVRDVLDQRGDAASRLLLAATRLADEDVVAAAAGLACIAGAIEPIFAVAVLSGTAWALLLPTALGVDAGRARSFLVYAAGLGLLAFLVSRMPVDAIFESLRHVGVSALWVFGLALFFYITLTLALRVLLGGRVPLGSVLYATLVGNAYNQILPLAGLGGEPYKIKLLTAHVPLDRASQSVVLDRLLHAVPGPLFGGVLLVLASFMVEITGMTVASIATAAALLLAISGVLLFVSFSPYPTRVTAAVLERLGALEAIRRERIPRRRVAAALSWKFLGQAFHIFEIWIIFRLLGFAATPEQVIAVSAAVFASSAIFFVFPQGLGVNEAGITGAFALLGLPPHLGLAFGLIRRGRLVLWALLGLALHLGVALMRRLVTQPKTAVAAAEKPTL